MGAVAALLMADDSGPGGPGASGVHVQRRTQTMVRGLKMQLEDQVAVRACMHACVLCVRACVRACTFGAHKK